MKNDASVPPTFSHLVSMDVTVKVVDIGANPIDGDPPYAGMLIAGNAEIVGFEPNPAALAALNRSKGPRETYLQHAIGDGQQHTLHICAAPGMTSLLKPNSQVLNLFHGFAEWGRVLATEEVDTIRLDDVPEAAGADLLKLDIQGAEHMVLKHASQCLQSAAVIQVEVEFLPLYVNQPLFSDVESLLRAQGFSFHKFHPIVSRVIQPLVVGGNIYSGLSQQVWADAIFIRNLTSLHLVPDNVLLKSAAILHDCYSSFDAVVHFLTEYDKRCRTEIAARYLENLRASVQPAPLPRVAA